MSFRSIFFLLNVVLIVAFAFIFSVPLLILRPHTVAFSGASSGMLLWLPAALFIIVLTAINTYFLRHWRLFTLLDRQDWPATAALPPLQCP